MVCVYVGDGKSDDGGYDYDGGWWFFKLHTIVNLTYIR
jgi:hypothetical protein